MTAFAAHIVDALQLAADDRAGRNRGDLHVGHLDVDAELGGAIDLAGNVETLGRGADQREVLRLLKRDIGGNRQLRRGVGQRAIAEPAAAGGMDHLALLGAAGGGIHVPGLRGSRDQHGPRRRARHAKWFPEDAHRGRAAGHLEANGWIAVELVTGRRMFELHLREIHLQFLGDQHRHRGVGALAHLDLRHDQRDLPVAADADERVRREICGFGGIGRIDPARQADAKQQSSASSESRRQHGAAADLLGAN